MVHWTQACVVVALGLRAIGQFPVPISAILLSKSLLAALPGLGSRCHADFTCGVATPIRLGGSKLAGLALSCLREHTSFSYLAMAARPLKWAFGDGSPPSSPFGSHCSEEEPEEPPGVLINTSITPLLGSRPRSSDFATELASFLVQLAEDDVDLLPLERVCPQLQPVSARPPVRLRPLHAFRLERYLRHSSRHRAGAFLRVAPHAVLGIASFGL